MTMNTNWGECVASEGGHAGSESERPLPDRTGDARVSERSEEAAGRATHEAKFWKV